MIEETVMSSPCLCWSTRDDGILISVNDTVYKKTGYSPPELDGLKVDVLFTVATRIFQQTHLFPLLKMHGIAEEIFITLRTKNDGSLPVLVNAQRHDVDGQTRIDYAGIVVHQRKKFEDELIAARKAAETALLENTALQTAQQDIQRHLADLDRQMQEVAQRHEELRQFNRVVSHDLQEPLRKSSLFLDYLKHELPAEFNPRSMQRLTVAMERLRSIIYGLQQYIWLTDSELVYEEIDLTSLIAELQEQLADDFAGTTIQLQVDELPQVNGDRQQIGFLMHELMSNAIRFRKQDAPASVRISGTTLMLNKYKQLPGRFHYTNYIRIDISDNGIGFNEQYKDQALELFRRLHPQSGRGVGLALCKKIIDNHQGNLNIHTSPSTGTTVSFFLPLLPPGNEKEPSSLNQISGNVS